MIATGGASGDSEDAAFWGEFLQACENVVSAASSS